MAPTRVPGLVKNLYQIVSQLQSIFPGRPFTPDGHMVGSLGECLAALQYDITLMKPSNGGYDAITPANQKVEIKTTQGKSVAFRSGPEFVLVLKLDLEGTVDCIYNGPGLPIWSLFDGKPRPSNGQYQVSLNTLARLNKSVQEGDRIKCRIGAIPEVGVSSIHGL